MIPLGIFFASKLLKARASFNCVNNVLKLNKVPIQGAYDGE
jgi:hypothetical protein